MKPIESDYNLTSIENFRNELYNYFVVRYAIMNKEKDFISNNFPNIHDQEKIILILSEMIKVNNIFYLTKDKNILRNTLELIKNTRYHTDDKEVIFASNEIILVINELLNLDENLMNSGQDIYLKLEANIRRIPKDISPFIHNAVLDFIESDHMLINHLVKKEDLEEIYPLNIISSINMVLYFYEVTDIYDKDLTDTLSKILEKQKEVIKEGKFLVGNIFDKIYQKKLLTKYILETENNIFEIEENKKNYVKRI